MNDICGLLAFGIGGEQKKTLMGELKKHGVIYDKFTGKLMLDVRNNDIVGADRTDKMGLFSVPISNETKKFLIDKLRDLKIIYADFLGKLLFNVNQGGLTSLERTDIIR